LEYYDNGELFQITDTAGVATQFGKYNGLFNLITPSGTTVFTRGERQRALLRKRHERESLAESHVAG
jgi:hypothetical protein